MTAKPKPRRKPAKARAPADPEAIFSIKFEDTVPGRAAFDLFTQGFRQNLAAGQAEKAAFLLALSVAIREL